MGVLIQVSLYSHVDRSQMSSEPKAYTRILNDGVETVPVSAIKTHPRNPRRGDLDAVTSSISINGFYGSLVVNRRSGFIVAGNHRYIAAKELGYESLPVSWIDVGEAEERRILAADNRTSDLGGYDDAVLASLLESIQEDETGLDGTGYSDDDLGELLDGLLDGFDDDEEVYTQKVESPIYEPTGAKPSIKELYDQEAMTKLIEAIEKSSLDDEAKDFLALAAYRHVVFRYDHIAEYYAHADAELQGLMEDSALVIIDFDKAIEKGFVRMTQALAEAYNDER